MTVRHLLSDDDLTRALVALAPRLSADATVIVERAKRSAAPDWAAAGLEAERDRAYGDVYAYMMLAEGRLEMVAEFDVKEYDIAAAVPIVREAGGRFTSFDGADSISERSSLATNGTLHDAFFELTRAND